MTKGELLETLKEMFIERFGIGVDVDVKEHIEIDYSWDVGSTYITKIRYNGEKFEYWKDCFGGGWEYKRNVFNKYGIAALSDCLGVKVRSRTEYFID